MPKSVIEQCGFQVEVEIEVHDRQLKIRFADHLRAGWSTAFARMSDYGDDRLLDQVAEQGSNWGAEE